MRNLLLTLRFDGSAFHGWQIQPNGVTVQAVLGTALERILGHRPNTHGCSRTDAGVHAREFYCSFRTGNPIPADRLQVALNFYLPPQIAVLACREVPAGFHARYGCASKTYCYQIHNARVRDPFLQGRALQEAQPLDTALLAREARDFVGTHDFAAFCAAGSSVQSTVRTLRRAEALRTGEELRLFFEADGFLYNMVRIMVGTLLEIGRGKRPPGMLPQMIADKDRKQAGYTAPAHGLYLWAVTYPKNALEQAQ
ncbi:MAG: tRNA pseudouridine(38-40) synthase TruA [Oscillospiraceae bacterium]|jgi:tRNA pseudouridine38-40 synthase|nr:tRNA pseudouridine(38-40) synthase TruA [Oscillospiraceae bacterium]